MRPELCVGAIAVHEGQLLLVRRGREPGAGAWSVPGGRVEAGETLAQALVREMTEETDLTARPGPLVGWVELIGPNHHFVILDFLVTVANPEQVRAADDAADASWVRLEEVTDLPLVEGLEEFLRAHGVLPSTAQPPAPS